MNLSKKTDSGPAMAAVFASQDTAVGAVVLHRTAELHGDLSAVFMARVWTRTTLGAMRWAGDIDRAVETASRLVDNALRHGTPDNIPVDQRRISLSAALTDLGALVLDVPDLTPAFPDFDAAVRGERGRGLWTIARLGVRIAWFLPHEGDGKTVRAVIPLLVPCSSLPAHHR
ncbi:ATP-binding protein [Streptomyces sp. NPDC101151]|uniref:ATP-binding protein n=1 Tax=Streptomyces sp. NPDC101151 TaxID=3366115 RepID=UPI003802DEDB